MKKNIGFIVLGAIIVVSIVIFFSRKNKENYITDNEYLYEIAIDYLKEQDNKENNQTHEQKGYHFFVAYDILGITEKNDKKYAYMWVLGESYYLDREEIKEGSGYSIFHRFTFKDDKVINVEIPKDGSEYAKSVKDLCPDKKMEKVVLKYESKLSVKDQVYSYYVNNKRK